jgi:SAM-dependent methyltransferase
MSCCSVPAGDTGRFFSRLSPLYRVRYGLLGLEKTQKHLIEGIRGAGLDGAAVLEIGCGTGDLQRAVLAEGAARTEGVDLSPRMLAAARRLARAAGLAARTAYREGDFVALADGIEPADITVLHKVVCCYPDVDALLDRSLVKTRRIYALTYPRDRLRVRFWFDLTARLLRLAGSVFRVYVHEPERMRRRIASDGFTLAYARSTASWHSEVYVRG